MSKNIIFTVSDPKYFNKFSVPLVISCIKYNMPLYLGVLNPDDTSKAILSFIADYVMASNAEKLISCAIEEKELPPYWEKGVWAACGRLRHAQRYFENMPEDRDDRLFLLDVDSVIRQHFEFPNCDLGLIIDPLRHEGKVIEWKDPWKSSGSKILMSGFFSKKTLPLMKHANHICESLHYGRWMLDQYALQESLSNEQFKSIADDVYNFYGTDYLHYGPWGNDAYVWTGKSFKLDKFHHYPQLVREHFDEFLRVVINHENNRDLNIKGLLNIIGFKPEPDFDVKSV